MTYSEENEPVVVHPDFEVHVGEFVFRVRRNEHSSTYDIAFVTPLNRTAHTDVDTETEVVPVCQELADALAESQGWVVTARQSEELLLTMLDYDVSYRKAKEKAKEKAAKKAKK